MPTKTLNSPGENLSEKRIRAITRNYARLRVAVVGDYCLDRYFDIDPALAEVSIETDLPVHNVVRTRCFPGGSGTIVNNLAALGIGHIHPVGFCGDDGEGWELRRALGQLPGIQLDDFLTTTKRQTFTYSKPLLVEPGKPPVELSRLDIKNRNQTPLAVSRALIQSIDSLWPKVDAIILLEQTSLPETGVLTSPVLRHIRQLHRKDPRRFVLADSRRGLAHFPPVALKMNADELARMTNQPLSESLDACREVASSLARKNQQPVFVTLAARGIMAAEASGQTFHLPALPIRGPIDIVGAGDSVTANLTATVAAQGTLQEAAAMAMAAASIVVHKLGVTGTASPREILNVLNPCEGMSYVHGAS
jgi:rfaE bifunctional protein kinase chain/domain